MKTKYFIDRDGVYIGGFCGATPPQDAIEVPFPPDHASQVFKNGAWSINKASKRDILRLAHEQEQTKPVGLWHGGFDSAMRLDAARRLAEAAGLTEVTFFDVDNVPHVLTLAEALQVCLQVGQKAAMDFAKKQSLMIATENATTQEELDNIQW